LYLIRCHVLRKLHLPAPRRICKIIVVICFLATLRKTSKRICMTFSRKVGNGQVNKCLNFDGDPDYRLDTRIVFRVRHYWEIRKVVNGYSFILIRRMAGLVRVTCLGGGMHCPSASSFYLSMSGSSTVSDFILPIVVRWCPDGDFLRPVLSASRACSTFQICIVNSH